MHKNTFFLTVFLGIAAIGILAVNIANRRAITPPSLPTPTIETPTPTLLTGPTASPTAQLKVNTSAAPLISCTGPDGKQFQTTQKACNDLNNAWKTKPTATPTQGPTGKSIPKITAPPFPPTGNPNAPRQMQELLGQ